MRRERKMKTNDNIDKAAHAWLYAVQALDRQHIHIAGHPVL